MKNEHDVIDSLEELERFLLTIENGGLGLKDVAGVGMATNNTDGRPFVAVFDNNQKLILAQWISQDVYENGKNLVRNGPQRKH
ncbi:hypothetical protein [Photobacterium indicum]|uniref:hypothetical protein n=1 Tax=Photobacterium indicum TaxID=81447 RepID=UPI003D14E4F5